MFTVDSRAADYPLEREQHGKVTEGIAAHNEGRSATDPLTGVEVPAPAGADRETKDRLAAYDHYSDDELRAAAAMSSAESAAAVSRNPLSISFVAFQHCDRCGQSLKGTVTKQIGSLVALFIVGMILVLVVATSGGSADEATLESEVEIVAELESEDQSSGDDNSALHLSAVSLGTYLHWYLLDTSPLLSRGVFCGQVVTVKALVSSFIFFALGFNIIRLKHIGATMEGSSFLEPEAIAAHVETISQRTMSTSRPFLQGGQRLGGAEKTTSQNPMIKSPPVSARPSQPEPEPEEAED